MRDLISKSALLEEFFKDTPHCQYVGVKYVDDLIKKQPTIEPKADWISCEERLPEELEEVLVWYEYFRYGRYNCMYQTYGIGYHMDGFWGGDVSGDKARCIAWQPLPQPYKKGGAEDEL